MCIRYLAELVLKYSIILLNMLHLKSDKNKVYYLEIILNQVVFS